MRMRNLFVVFLLVLALSAVIPGAWVLFMINKFGDLGLIPQENFLPMLFYLQVFQLGFFVFVGLLFVLSSYLKGEEPPQRIVVQQPAAQPKIEELTVDEKQFLQAYRIAKKQKEEYDKKHAEAQVKTVFVDDIENPLDEHGAPKRWEEEEFE